MWLLMPDGVRLSATLAIPVSKHNDEKFPVLFEYKPYRKDDNFFNFDQPNIFYLARRGFIVAKVDIRGTGSSEGVLIEREYTTQELDDCEHVIEQLADYYRSNGRVGMYGLSWSGFNSLMMAILRRPTALKAIFAAHATDDLYKNDIHYPDGILHLDHYIVSIDQTNALPATPDYLINEEWIKQRFTRRPWSDVYLEHQLDDDSFWRKHSIKYAYDNLTIPVYLIGGLYDPYKDVPINIYEHARQVSPKIKVVVGPFAHAMPENTNRNPGPGFDSMAEMVRWFNYWLNDKNKNNDILNEPDITLFIRTNLTAGNYRYESEWPIPRQRIRRMYMNKGRILTEQAISDTENECVNNHVDTLKYRPWIGFEGGLWLGGLTGDQQPFDEDCLVYQTDPIHETIEIVGFVNVSLQVSATAPLAHWIVRLEDVDIDGRVWLVTTGAINGAQRQTPPANLEPNRRYIIPLRLRFTTWTFFPGHRIRIAVSNAMFPTYWPSPFAMNTSLFLNSSTTFIDLPVIHSISSTSSPPPSFTQQQVPPDDILSESFSGGKPRIYRKHETNLSTTIIFERLTYELLPRNIFISTLLAWNITCSHSDPADVQWKGQAQQFYVYDMHGYASVNDIPMIDDDKGLYPNVDLSKRRHFEINVNLTVYSDQDYFYINFNRQLFRLNRITDELPLTFTFNSKKKRQFQ
ncbi:unnamed protein product [Rotaria sp. Silwood1]|nr:unnamed protein product [Rotaria sp. Silwood1]CAF4955183.1 unnamed protein product [Rotaria sp. Silwood1]